MSQAAEIEYSEQMQLMMALAGATGRIGLDLSYTKPIYEAWGELYPTDAYAWLSKALIEIGENNFAAAKSYVQDALDQAETNREAAEEAMQWIKEEEQRQSS
ncbi:mRNA 3'-end-processing protein RNA14 [Roseibium sp. TrichSKD4]|uniref:hypothetical protein n=1 Tax=Roseibium sp. TrichSKD4 TaxID=744980 RepID=UPI0001E56A88|nr:hypothetical protein [Roseibium sp. TrichSKD4]EFO31924.1 mRNA 3'-end-processing protein RNA14 [Roseibium sp. TrichSKD4]